MKGKLTVTVGDAIDNTAYDKIHGQEDALVSGMSFDELCAYYASKGYHEPYRVYVIRDAETVLYVGKSIDIPSRLGEHLGLYGRFGPGYPDRIGCVIHENLPESRSWAVDLLTVTACRKELGMAMDGLNWDVDKAEREMIRSLRPCVNVTYNEHGNPLPDQYRR